ncbi:cytochrome c3 family protein [Candidatus Deferrimicrobium sp.]|uniref:cytochrome c3 family protein n=1 Tax=Candidatus Deferrimicrobium sp. TaxID=3060586 RepID=UPI002ED79A31
MIRGRSRRGLVPGIVILAACLAAGVASSAPPQEKGNAVKPHAANAQEKQFAVPTPPFTPGIFPCSECHKEMKPNPRRRELKDEHTNIVLNHAEGQRWCLDCHDVSNRDKLRLVSGEKIGFDESFRLCGQCHGDKYRDWKVGVHGKRTGMWNGEKQYLLCVHCHNPHDPRFKPIQPMPAPARPEDTK